MKEASLLVLAVVLAACSPQATGSTRSSISTAPATATQAASSQPSITSTGCGSTAVLAGGIPQWLNDAGGHNNPLGVPYVIAQPPLAAGFLFGYPLHAGHPNNPSNKILWVVRTARNGPLTIDAHPLTATSPVVHQVFPDNAGPGEIYPSGVDVPTAGCWQLDLRWAGSHTEVELSYVSP
ncbi:MAG TPA: hypothetical protein VHW91_10240 [Candidatus Dormibacteraeota bacterium]|nr:hypothetical protein [Candidatus Dormibacteraeota bacterium]